MSATITQHDYQMLIEQYNQTEDSTTLGFCLPRVFEDVAARYPDHVAVISGDSRLTYESLNQRANQFAHILVADKDVRRGDVVGVALDRSTDLLVAILAVLKAGAAYVPVDPSLPSDRVTNMMENAQPKLVIVSGTTSSALISWKDVCLSIDDVQDHIASSKGGNLTARHARPDDLAYIIYTSGSTGRPKGVEANHGALCNLMLSMQKREPGCSTRDCVLAVATISFDMSILDLLLPLTSGATCVVPKTSQLRDPPALIDLMETHGVTMIQATPSFFQMLLDGGWNGNPRLSKLLTAGEPISRRLLDRLLQYSDEVYNGYGPTEATIYSSVGLVSREHRDIIIGDPIANFKLYVLREDLSPAPLGELGELYIGGYGVNCGYRNNPDLTRSRFLANNPFHTGRLYQSGDLARFIGPGKLCLVGRTDSQVKVRGYRIELGDVSAAITEHEDVSAAVVTTREDQLVAYYVRKSNKHTENDSETSSKVISGNSSDSGIVLDEDESGTFDPKIKQPLDSVLRLWMSQRRPSYMVPTFFVEMDSFPITVNGKVDKKALPEPTMSLQDNLVKLDQPQNELGRCVMAVWCNVLGHNCIGANDNFFLVGGNSLRVPRVTTELAKLLKRPVSAAKLFEHYTVRMLAAYLQASEASGYSSTQNMDSLTKLSQESHGSLNDQTGNIDQKDEPIAIISMACNLPGNVTSPEEYWNMLENGHHGITDVPKDRWDAAAIYDADPDTPGKTYCVRGGFITAPLNSFDASFFGISPREAKSIEPSHHVMLETCWEGLERAGYTISQLRGSQTGVFIGQTNVSAYNTGWDMESLDGYAVTGSIGATLSGRVSYLFGLEGPSLTLDTACSSSLVSTHLACNALRQGECDMALAGGVTILSPELLVEFSRLRGISPDGSCRAFSSDTEGTGFSEGSTVIVLKRLSDARRDGDTIQAVLRGSAVNHGGRRAATLTTPSGAAQTRLIRTALNVAGLKPSDIDYIDAHGTATKLGDPIEGTALAEVFEAREPAQDPLWVGSAKSNLGHTQAAAGLASVLKVVLAMQNKTLPQTLHVAERSPMIDWDAARMALVLKKQVWQPTSNKPRRAGVSSFGISGTNAHVIVEEAPLQETSTSRTAILQTMSPMARFFLLSGGSSAALSQQAGKLHKHIERTKITDENQYLDDLSFSLATSRTHFRKRLVLTANNTKDLLEQLAAYSIASPDHTAFIPGIIHSNSQNSEREPRLAMLFTGQGSQMNGMGKQLAQAYPVFDTALRNIAAQFTHLKAPLLDVMWADHQTEQGQLLHRTDFAQPAIFALEIALWHLWRSWGVNPTVVLGHSIGEISAIHVAGVLSLSDACKLVAARGMLMQEITPGQPGGMASLEANAAEVRDALSTLGLDLQADIAGYNTPTQTVVSGDMGAIETIAAHFAGTRGRKIKKLEVSQAFHSYHMDGMLSALQTVAEGLTFHPPTVAVVSSLTGRMVEANEIQRPAYWVLQARRAVRFNDAICSCFQQDVDMVIELGAQPVLLGMTAACLSAAQEESGNDLPPLLPSLQTGKKNDVLAMQHTLAELHVRQVPVDWSSYYKSFACNRIDLPTYAFQRENFGRHKPVPRIKTSGEDQNLANERQSEDFTGSNRFQFEINWYAAVRSKNALKERRSWGILQADKVDTWSSDIKTALVEAGIRLTVVRTVEDAEQLDGVICFWDDASRTSTISQAYQFVEAGLTQVQDAARIGLAPPLVWVTRRAVGVNTDHSALQEKLLYGDDQSSNNEDNEDDNALFAGPLWGLMRTARSEHSELCLHLIDIDNVKSELQDLASLLLSGVDEPEYAFREGNLLVPRMERVQPQSLEQNLHPRLRKDGAVLITGGLGGIGKQVAHRLAAAHHVCDIVLTSRSGMQTTGAQAFIEEMAQLGVKIEVIACDVSDLGSVRSVMARFGVGRPLRGVIHAAGVVDNGVLSNMTPERCATVFAPKVDGAWNLHQVTKDMDLDVFMMFSSIAGVLGMVGLGNYAAANTFMDVLAHSRCQQGLPATAVAYGVWSGDGMVAGLTGRTTLNHLAKLGLDPLVPENGLDILEMAVCSGRALTVGAGFDLERLQNYINEEENDEPDKAALYSRLFNKTGDNHFSTSENKAQTGAQSQSLQEVLQQAKREEHDAIVLAMVRETVAKALGFESPDQVSVDMPLQELGFDSLTAVLMRNQLAKLTNLKTLSATWNYPNLKALGCYLLSQLNDQLAAESSTGDVKPIEAVSGIDVASIKKGYLDPSFAFDNISEAPKPRSVFITGATGFVGAFMLHELLAVGIECHCLVRADSINHGKQRLLKALADYDLWKVEFEALLKPTNGDLSQPLFNLSEQDFDKLANEVDAICHCAALVDWMRPLDQYLGPNVVSTHEVLRLASRGRGKAIHVVSTLATLPMHLGYEVPETDREYGYSTSKYMAERMVAAARWRGAQASVYRVPFVTASASNGHFRLDRGDFLHNMIAGSIDMGSFPSLDADLSVVQPVDYLCRTIVSVMVNDRSRIGNDFDFVNKYAATANFFFERMASISNDGRKYEFLPFSQWKAKALDYAVAYPKSALARISAIVDGLADATAAAGMLTGLPTGGQVFGGDIYPAPAVDDELVRNYRKRIDADRE